MHASHSFAQETGTVGPLVAFVESVGEIVVELTAAEVAAVVFVYEVVVVVAYFVVVVAFVVDFVAYIPGVLAGGRKVTGTGGKFTSENGFEGLAYSRPVPDP